MVSRTSIRFSVGAAAIVASTFVWIACSGTSSTAGNGTGGGNDGGSSSGGGFGSGSGGSGSGGSGSGGGSSSGSASSGSGSGGSGSGGSSSGGGGSGSGSSSGAATDAGCPGTACQGGETCCADIATASPVCEGNCPTGDSIACTGPADCAGSTDGGTECCGTAVLADNPDGAAFPYCEISSLTSYCGHCSTNIQFSCNQVTDTLHVCTSKADCASDNGDSCCTVYNYNICVPALVATAAKFPCLN